MSKARTKKRRKAEASVQQQDCGGAKDYKGIHEPKCNGGDGCWPCWAKYILNNPKWDQV